jgi:(2R)-3-sulfolactate dehydrogenase (NADP+)
MDTQLSQRPSIRSSYKNISCFWSNRRKCNALANGIIQAEIDGIKSHGFHYLPIYCLHLSCKKVRGNASPKKNHKSNVALSVDADNGFAHRAISIGFEDLIPSAKENGIASLAISNSYNCGVLGYHTKTIADENLIGIGFTNAPASIAPLGGIKPVIGTNPFSVAIKSEGSVKF